MSAERYSHVESRKREGAHYTPEVFSDFISENILKMSALPNAVKIVDPAIGDGELLVSLIKKLHNHGVYDIDVYGFDTNLESVEITRNRLKENFPQINPQLINKDFLEICLEKEKHSKSRDLFSAEEIPDFDLLIANPPYIRTQVLGAERAQELSKNFGLKGRVDIYQAFLVAMNAVLKPTAVAGVIVSNRFLTTKGASNFREILFNQYDLKGIWDFGDTNVFEAAVLPAVMILTPCTGRNNHNIPFLSIYKSTKSGLAKSPKVMNQIEALAFDGIVLGQDSVYEVKHGHLTFDSKPSDLWRLQDLRSEKWLQEINRKTWCHFKDIGKIRVGVKTTADKVFIKSNWDAEVGYTPELVKPLTTHHVAERFKSSNQNLKSILYTHKVESGKRCAIDISKYPLSQKYLKANKKQLSGREYVIKANRNWFEIWVPQNPSLWIEDKVIFRDISEQPTFWMDKEHTVVNGDCYWMLRDNKDMPEDILWLVLSIANSKFIEYFYDIKFQNKLYSNKRRFITQYVEQFPIPDPNLPEAIELIKLAKKRFEETKDSCKKSLETNIDELVWSVFGKPD